MDNDKQLKKKKPCRTQEKPGSSDRWLTPWKPVFFL